MRAVGRGCRGGVRVRVCVGLGPCDRIRLGHAWRHDAQPLPFPTLLLPALHVCSGRGSDREPRCGGGH